MKGLTHKLQANSIDAIITEPYLGKPLTGRETKWFLQNQARELTKLYFAAFQVFQKILKPGGVVVFITPSFKHRDGWITLADDPFQLVEKVGKLGFKPAPLTPGHPAPIFTRSRKIGAAFRRYHRPDQRLARDIWRFLLLTCKKIKRSHHQSAPLLRQGSPYKL